MRTQEIENRVNGVVAAVLAGSPYEDSVYELKTDWIDPEKAARRIAGHANAASPDPVIWIIGIDEKAKKIMPPASNDLSTWWPQVQSKFEFGFSPRMQDLAIHTAHGVIYALAFETDRAPYVIKNAAGGQISKEVPWREGTRVETATRANLLSILVPIAKVPTYTVTYSSMRVGPSTLDAEKNEPKHSWGIWVTAYIVSESDRALHSPFHVGSASLTIAGQMSPFCTLDKFAYGGQPDGPIQADTSQFIIRETGELKIIASGRTDTVQPFPKEITARFTFPILESTGRPLNIEVPLHLTREKRESVHDFLGRKIQEIACYDLKRP